MPSEPFPSKHESPGAVPNASGGRRSRPVIVPRRAGSQGDLLAPGAVDAALSDETTPLGAQRGSRRELSAPADADKGKRTVDVSHRKAGSERLASPPSKLLESLAEQLRSLQSQQDQIRRLLDRVERSGVS